MVESLQRGCTATELASLIPPQPGPAERPSRTGVLLVHGMGSAAPGDTLRGLGEPLLETMRQLAGGSVGAVTELDLTGGEQAPAHAVVQGDRTEWVLAECHWGECFRLPGYRRLCSWLLLAVPWSASSYFRSKLAQRAARRNGGPRTWRDWFFGATGVIGGTVLAPVLAGVVALVLVLLLPLSVLPVPFLQRLARSLVGVLSGSLGDVYVLLSDGFDRVVVEQRLRRDLDHLLVTRRCDQVVLVAHSAGSRLCHQVLQGSTEDRDRAVRRLVSYGQAVWRADATERLAGTTRGRRALGLSIASALGLVVGGYLASLQVFSIVWWPYGSWGRVQSWSALGAGLVVAGVVAGVLGVRAAGASDHRHVNGLLPLRVLGRPVLWRDYVASADPVPDGRMVGREQGCVAGFQSVRLHNLRSVVRDHTSYVSSDVFLRCVARDVLQVGGVPVLEDTTPTRDERWAARRRRTRRLSTMRNTVLLAAVWTYVTATWWPAQVVDGRLAAPASPDDSPAMGLAGRLAAVLPDALATTLLGDSTDSPWRRKLLGLLAVAAVLFGLYHCLFLLWQRWDRRWQRWGSGLAADEPGGSAPFLLAWVGLLVLLLGTAPVLGQPLTLGSTSVWRAGVPSADWTWAVSLVLGLACALLVLQSVLDGLERDEPDPGDPWDDADWQPQGVTGTRVSASVG